MALYDYLYVDLQKVISLYSQMTGGVVEILERTSERSTSADSKRNYDFKVFKHDAGGTNVDLEGSRATVKPHHALLKELENALREQGYLLDLTDPAIGNSFKSAEMRAQLKRAFCVKATGRVVVEDYERIKSIAATFPEIMAFISKSSAKAVKESDDFKSLAALVEGASALAAEKKDRNERVKAEREIKVLKEKLSSMVEASSAKGNVDQWVLDGMKTWIDAYLPGITNLRVYPFTDAPDEHLIGHLKRQCFEDSDPSSFNFTYGSFPTENLTVLGIVTSVPDEAGEKFDPLIELRAESAPAGLAVERGFRGVFRGFDGIEKLIRTARFPRVMVLPLTVYRAVDPK